MEEGSNLQHISNLLRNMRQPSAEQKIALPQREGYEFVDVSSIIYCQAEGAYTKVFIQEKRPCLFQEPWEMWKNYYHRRYFSGSIIPHLSMLLTFLNFCGLMADMLF